MSRSGRERAQAERQAGRLWRAKEILRGHIGAKPYDSTLCLEYGEVLLELGDVPEAGKYLFLAGSELSEHAESVRVFLERHGKSVEQLQAHFPSRARGLAPEAYPPLVQRVLEQGGYPTPGREHRRPSASTRAAVHGCRIVMVVLAFCTVVGMVQVVMWIVKVMF